MNEIEDIKGMVFQQLLLNYVKEDIRCVFEDCEYDLWFKEKESEMEDVINQLAEQFIDNNELIRWEDLIEFVAENIGDYWEE